MRKLAATSALLLAGTVLAVTPPAHAAAGGNIYHAADAGYNRAINVTCWGGGFRDVYEGQSSGCNYGTTSVYVYAGQEVWCYHQYVGYVLTWDATGSHDTAGYPAMSCVSQAD